MVGTLITIVYTSLSFILDDDNIEPSPFDGQTQEAQTDTPPDASSNGITGSSSSSDTSTKQNGVPPEFENINTTPPLLVRDLNMMNSHKLSLSSTAYSINVNDSWSDMVSTSVSRDSMRKDDIIIPSFSSNTWRSSLRPSKSRRAKYNEGVENKTISSSSNPFLKSIFKSAMYYFNIDVPLCTQCANVYLTTLQDELDYLEYDIESYEDYSTQLDHKYYDTDHYSENIQTLNEAKKTYHSKLEQLLTLQQELNVDIENIAVEEEALKQETAAFWNQKNHLDQNVLLVLNDSTAIVNNQKLLEKLDLLRSSNVIHDAFHISTDGHFATINDLRLVKLPVLTADITEISSALGFVIHLFVVMVNCFGMKFKTYSPKISGSNMQMVRMKDNSLFELCAEHDGIRAKFGLKKSQTISAFLKCITEFIEKIQTKDSEFLFDHNIDYESCIIDESNLKKGIHAPEEHFTKGFKSLLTVLKRILLWLTQNKYL